MQYSAKDFRTMAREALKGKWTTAIIVAVVATILGALTTADTLVNFEFGNETGIY